MEVYGFEQVVHCLCGMERRLVLLHMVVVVW